MAAEHTDFSDTDLSAWLDGALDEEGVERVDAWLRSDADAAARLRLMTADRDAIRARFDGVLHEDVPPALLGRVLPPQRVPGFGRWPRGAVAASMLAAGILLGSTLGWQWQSHRTTFAQSEAAQGWVLRAALAHAAFAPDERHPVEVHAQEDHLLRWLERRTNLPVRLYNLRSAGFDLLGGRLVPESAAGPSAQLMYQDAGGRRVTLYLRKPDSSATAAFRHAREEALNVVYWSESDCGYALVGAVPREQLLAMAETVERQDADADADARTRTTR